MKSRVVNVGLSSILFFSMIFASLALVRPAILGFAQRLEDYRGQLLAMVEEKTGLRVSYESLSPAILSAFRIKGIVLSDVETGEPVLSVRTASLSYSILRLLAADMESAFSRLTVAGIVLEYDALRNSRLLERLLSLASSVEAGSDGGSLDGDSGTDAHGGEGAAVGPSMAGSGGGEGVAIALPFDIDIRDVSLHYRDSLLDALVTFRGIAVTDMPGQGFLQAEAEGSCRVSFHGQALAALPEELRRGVGQVSMDLALDASILPRLDGSSAGIRLSSISTQDFSLARTSLLAEYSQGLVRVSTMQGALPLAVLGEVDTVGGRVRLLAQMDGFDPLSYLRPRRSVPLLERMRGTRVSGRYEFRLDTGSLAFDYNVDGGILLPAGLLSEEALPGGVALDYRFSGDRADLQVDSLRMSSQNLDFSLEGSLNLPNMRASGFAFLERLSVPGSGDISAELYIDPLDQGFTCFVPQLYFGERSLTALQLTMIPAGDGRSIDFEFEASDYSRIDFGVPGLISLSGSILDEGGPYLQANLGVNDFFIESAFSLASFFVPQDQRPGLESLAASLSPYVTTSELYLATDFSSVSYNVDYWILADTKNDDNLLVFSFTGNETTASLTRFDLLLAGQEMQMTAAVDFDETYTSAFFNADVSVNAVPYSLSGSYTAGSWLNVTGSYGLSATAAFGGEENLVEGQLSVSELPLSVGSAMILCSLDAGGAVPRVSPSDFRLDINSLSLHEIAGFFPTNPQLSMAGHMTSHGFMLERFLFRDTVSTLTGTGGIRWGLGQGRLDTAGLSLSLASSGSSESYSLGLDLSNPGRLPFGELDLFNDLYFTAQLEATDLPVARFRPLQNEGNVASGVMTAMGTIQNPYVSLEILPSSISFGGSPVSLSASARLEDGEVFLSAADIGFGGQTISDVSARFSLADFSGSLHAQYDADLGGAYTISVPLDLSVTSSLEGTAGERGFLGIADTLARGLPDYISVDAEAVLGGSLFKETQPVAVNVVRVPGFYNISSKDGLGISGSVTEEGFINLSLAGRMPVHATVQGTATGELLDIQLRDIRSDLSKFSTLVAFPFIMLHGGQLSGSLHLGGIPADPQFSGQLQAADLTINCPDYVPELMVSQLALIQFQDNELIMDGVPFRIRNGSATLDLRLVMDRWLLDTLYVNVNTPQGVLVPALVNIPARSEGAPSILIDGRSTCNLAIEVTPSQLDVRGRFYVEDVDIDIIPSGIWGQSTRQEGLVYPGGGEGRRLAKTFDLSVVTGQHVELVFEPLLRGLIAPNTRGTFRYDSASGAYSIDSDIVLRGGEISYLNRNFYLREGRVVFTENESLDPLITVRAEIREHDATGEPVRITMSAENQRLSAFTPSYSSSPARSEREIMTILGQVITGDAESGWDVLLSGVDYGLQSLLLSRVEDALRDFLNFDILSLRTMGLQNSLKQWLDVGGENNELTLGNFFDNTTVYIGKYFGSSIYADAMLHFEYDERKAMEDGSEAGLSFQPEIGLEMDSPFGAIRWSLAPDVGNTQNLWVPSTSISISWKFDL